MDEHKREEFDKFTQQILSLTEDKFLEGILAILSTYYPEQEITLPENMQVPENILMTAMLISQRIKEINEKGDTNKSI